MNFFMPVSVAPITSCKPCNTNTPANTSKKVSISGRPYTRPAIKPANNSNPTDKGIVTICLTRCDTQNTLPTSRLFSKTAISLIAPSTIPKCCDTPITPPIDITNPTKPYSAGENIRIIIMLCMMPSAVVTVLAPIDIA